MVVACTMGSFGAYLANPTILLGTDYLILKCIKYMAGRMRPMLPVNVRKTVSGPIHNQVAFSFSLTQVQNDEATGRLRADARDTEWGGIWNFPFRSRLIA